MHPCRVIGLAGQRPETFRRRMVDAECRRVEANWACPPASHPPRPRKSWSRPCGSVEGS